MGFQATVENEKENDRLGFRWAWLMIPCQIANDHALMLSTFSLLFLLFLAFSSY